MAFFSLPKVQRLLIKISGEMLQGDQSAGLSLSFMESLSQRFVGLAHKFQIAVVLGGGNFFRGAQYRGSFLHHGADKLGMLSTVMNGIALQEVLDKAGLKNRLFCAKWVEGVGEVYDSRNARNALDEGSLVICAGGTGCGAVTTDTAAVVRAVELNCDALVKATKVQGIYDDDPAKNPGAGHLPWVTYREVLEKRLGFMDSAAISLAETHSLPVVVLSLQSHLSLEGFNAFHEYSCVVSDVLACDARPL